MSKSIGSLGAALLTRKLASPFWKLPEGDRTPIEYAAQLNHFDAASELVVTETKADQRQEWKLLIYHVDYSVAVIEIVVRIVFPGVIIGAKS